VQARIGAANLVNLRQLFYFLYDVIDPTIARNPENPNLVQKTSVLIMEKV
jgi:hypothetical protein